MKLFAPRNDWNMTEPGGGWFGLMGGIMPSSSGVNVNQDIAMTCSAWFCGLRIISETLAMLPCQLVRHSGNRVTEQAEDHPLYRLLLDQPNREQDSMCWFDMQTAFVPSWGNSFAEIQRDSTGNIIALWPIHPSRIPLRNIVRNSTAVSDLQYIQAGQPGEIVYWISNDDGSKTPIPASDMLHVPGVLSQNGITGQSIIKWGAQSLGIIIATERHAGAFFRNGAASNMALTTDKVVGKETAERLRAQWQQQFAGADNHYKTLVLEEGMKPFPIDVNPENTQLLESRKFGPNEIARWLRLPPHMLGDLERATFSNIEQQSLDFVIYSLSPWAERWVRALKRQLLTEKEKQSMFFQFDIKKLLKADSAARAAYMQFKFNTGSASPNDIRATDGENPVEGGDTYFVQSNNYMPLDKVQEMAQAQIDKLTAPPPAPIAPQKEPPADAKPDQTADTVNALLAFEQEQSRLILESLSKTATVDDVKAATDDLRACAEKEADRVAERDAALMVAIEGTATPSEVFCESQKALAEREPAMHESMSEMARIAAVGVNTQTDSVVQECRDALQLAIEEILNGMMLYESGQGDRASRAEASAKTFGGWRSGFYAEFSPKLAGKLERFAIALRRTQSASFNPDEAASEWCRQSLVALEPVFDADAKERHDRFKQITSQWADRPKRFAAELLKGGAA